MLFGRTPESLENATLTSVIPDGIAALSGAVHLSDRVRMIRRLHDCTIVVSLASACTDHSTTPSSSDSSEQPPSGYVRTIQKGAHADGTFVVLKIDYAETPGAASLSDEGGDAVVVVRVTAAAAADGVPRAMKLRIEAGGPPEQASHGLSSSSKGDGGRPGGAAGHLTLQHGLHGSQSSLSSAIGAAGSAMRSPSQHGSVAGGGGAIAPALGSTRGESALRTTTSGSGPAVFAAPPLARSLGPVTEGFVGPPSASRAALSSGVPAAALGGGGGCCVMREAGWAPARAFGQPPAPPTPALARLTRGGGGGCPFGRVADGGGRSGPGPVAESFDSDSKTSLQQQPPSHNEGSMPPRTDVCPVEEQSEVAAADDAPAPRAATPGEDAIGPCAEDDAPPAGRASDPPGSPPPPPPPPVREPSDDNAFPLPPADAVLEELLEEKKPRLSSSARSVKGEFGRHSAPVWNTVDLGAAPPRGVSIRGSKDYDLHAGHQPLRTIAEPPGKVAFGHAGLAFLPTARFVTTVPATGAPKRDTDSARYSAAGGGELPAAGAFRSSYGAGSSHRRAVGSAEGSVFGSTSSAAGEAEQQSGRSTPDSERGFISSPLVDRFLEDCIALTTAAAQRASAASAATAAGADGPGGDGNSGGLAVSEPVPAAAEEGVSVGGGGDFTGGKVQDDGGGEAGHQEAGHDGHREHNTHHNKAVFAKLRRLKKARVSWIFGCAQCFALSFVVISVRALCFPCPHRAFCIVVNDTSLLIARWLVSAATRSPPAPLQATKELEHLKPSHTHLNGLARAIMLLSTAFYIANIVAMSFLLDNLQDSVHRIGDFGEVLKKTMLFSNEMQSLALMSAQYPAPLKNWSVPESLDTITLCVMISPL